MEDELLHFGIKYLSELDLRAFDSSKAEWMIENFDAAKARKLSDTCEARRLVYILCRIKEMAENSEKNRMIFIEGILNPAYVTELERRGFTVTLKPEPRQFHPNGTTQIEW